MMVVASDTMFGKQYSLLRCSKRDVNKHYAVVRELVKDVDKTAFKKRMYAAVEDNTAYKLKGIDCFLYYIKIGSRTGEGVCLYCKNNPIGLLMLFKMVFTEFDKDTVKLKIQPHSQENMLEYKSLVVKSGIRLWHLYGNPLTIRIDMITNKFRKLYERYTKG